MLLETRRVAKRGPHWRDVRMARSPANLREGSPHRWIGGPSGLILPLLVFLAAVPFAGLPLPTVWLAVMVALIAAEQRWLRSPRAPARGGGQAGSVFSWLSSVGYSIAALWFVLFYTGVAQTFGVTLYGVIMFQILAREYANPRRLLLNLVPPVLSMALVQGAAAAMRIEQGRIPEVVTLLASPCIVAWVFRMVQKDLTQNRRRLVEASDRTEASAREIEDAHRIAQMAEALAGVGHWRLDARSREFTLSAGVRRIYGLDPSDGTPGMDGMLALHGDEDRATVARKVTEAMAGGTPFSFESRITRPDGQIRRITANGAAERDAAGEVVTVFGASMDVTEAWNREQALRASESRFRLLADHSTDVIVWIALDGTILYASPSAASLGYTPEQVVGRKTFEFVHPDDRERAIAIIGGLFSGAPVDASVRREYRFLAGDGRYIWLEGNPTVLRDADGAPTSAVTSFRDVTSRRRLEDDLIEAKHRAEAAAEAKAEFLANMSHEIRTPLTGVIGFSGLLNGMDALPEAAKSHVRRIVNSGQALLAVVNDILDFSKLEAGQVDLDAQPFEARPFFEDTLAMFTERATAKGLDLQLDTDGSMPAFLRADRARLGQILANLLGNAIKFTDRGVIGVTAAFDVRRDQLRVAVTDTGAGIADDKLDRLFQRFSQVDGSVSRRHGGTGLGLSISKALAELMGGGIGVASTVGAGSTFEVWIAATPAARGAVAAGAARTAPRGDARPARVLVVDDLAVNRMLVRAILDAAGHFVEEAASGAAAMAAALGPPFDLILMDLQMPGMDGYASAKSIRALASANRLTPIVALSANVLPEHVTASGAAGMNDHLAKPIVPADLLEAVSRWAGVRVEDDEPARLAGSARN